MPHLNVGLIAKQRVHGFHSGCRCFASFPPRGRVAARLGAAAGAEDHVALQETDLIIRHIRGATFLDFTSKLVGGRLCIFPPMDVVAHTMEADILPPVKRVRPVQSGSYKPDKNYITFLTIVNIIGLKPVICDLLIISAFFSVQSVL